mgnify:CR=1 FL=1|jgi:hypothetical protein
MLGFFKLAYVFINHPLALESTESTERIPRTLRPKFGLDAPLRLHGSVLSVPSSERSERVVEICVGVGLIA